MTTTANSSVLISSGSNSSELLGNDTDETTVSYWQSESPTTTFGYSKEGDSGDNGEQKSSPSPEEIYCQIAAAILKSVISGGSAEAENATGNLTNTTQKAQGGQVCVDDMSNAKIHNFVLLSVACILSLFLTTQATRRIILPRLFGGRPAMLMPLPIAQPCNLRFTYVAFWGMVTYDAIGIVLGDAKNLVIGMACKPTWLKSIIILANVHIYAIIYFPVVGGISTGTVLGGLIATAWTWALTVVKIARIIATLQSETTVNMTAELFEHVIPVIFMLYLCTVLPIRLIRGVYLSYKMTKSMYEPIDDERPFLTSPEAHYVSELFRQKPLGNQATGLRKMVHRFIYRNQPCFRYSQTILSTLTIGGIFIYYILYLDAYYTSLLYPLIFSLEHAVGELIFNVTAMVESNSLSANVSEESFIERVATQSRFAVDVGAAYTWALMNSHIFALVIVGILQVILLATLLPAYRRDMLDAYKGKYGVLIHPSYTAPRTIINGALRYVGFQTVMYAWGLIIQLLVITMLAFLLNCIILIPLRLGFGQWIIDRIVDLLPTLGITVGLVVIQMLVVTFCFTLEPFGRTLAINNPRGYSNFVFLSFFKNIFIGIISALLRLVLAVVFGAIVFSRLDMPTIPPLFRMFDNGFRTYEALIHLENAHLNPSLVTFVNIVISGIQRRKEERRIVRNSNAQQQGFPGVAKETTPTQVNGLSPPSSGDRDIDNYVAETMRINTARRRAKFRWYMAKTMVLNPMIIHTRKESMDERKAKIEATARQKAEENMIVKRQNEKRGLFKRLMKVGIADSKEDGKP